MNISLNSWIACWLEWMQFDTLRFVDIVFPAFIELWVIPKTIFVDWRSFRECILFHHRVATMTWLTITECHSCSWTFSVVKIMSSFLCLYQARSVQSHNYLLRGYRFYLLVRGWFWILWLFWQCGIVCFSLYSSIVIYHRVCLLTSISTYVTRRMSLVEQKLLSLIISHSMIYVDNITRCN